MSDQPSQAVADAPPAPTGDSLRGLAFAIAAYSLWGFLPLYMKALAHLPSAEVVAHRVLWSVPVGGAILLALGRAGDVKAALRQPRTVAMAMVTAILVSITWGLYVWAIAADRAVETALGYYINPLVSVALAAILLGEKLSPAQMAAIGLAAVAVVILIFDAGGFPWLSITLALAFAFYGYFRKTLPIGPSQGFFLEVLLLSPIVVAYIVWLEWSGAGHFVHGTAGDILLLIGGGPVTAVPLILYAFGAKLLKYSTIGILQYIAPTMIFLIAVFIFGEPFSMVRAAAFVLIWAALAIYTWSMFSQRAGGKGAPSRLR